VQLLKSKTTTQQQKQTNADIINKYLKAMEIEVNPSKNYRSTITCALNYLSQFHLAKPYKRMKRDDIVAYLNSLRKPNDPSHRWIGT
jgi:integrase/recombinase XerD